MPSPTLHHQRGTVSLPFIGVFQDQADTDPSGSRRARLFASRVFRVFPSSAVCGLREQSSVHLAERLERREMTAEPPPANPNTLSRWYIHVA